MASRDAAIQSVAVNATGCGFDPHSRRCNIYLHLNFHFFVLVLRQKRVGESRLQNSTESGERSILTLGSLSLSCCVRDIA